MTRAAIYCRISQDRKVTTDDGEERFTRLGVERQEQDCRALCDTLGYEVVEVFVDNDISATSGKTRPAYKAMLEAIRADALDAIVAWHPDRLYRRTVDLEDLIAVCDKHRVPIATVNAGHVDLTTPTGRLVAGLLAQVAKYEGEHKSERWRAGYKQRRTQGHPPASGPRMFGWTRDGEIVEDEAAMIRWAAQEVLNGVSLHAVCIALRERGYTTSRGNQWRPTPLRGLLTNPRLAGQITIKGEIVGVSTWPAILDLDTSEALRAMCAVRKGRRGPLPRVGVLVGIVYCGICGTRMTTGRRSDAAKSRTYRCPPRAFGGNGCVDIAAEPVDEMVEAYAQARIVTPGFLERIRVASETGATAPKVAHEVSTLETRLVELQAALTDDDAPVVELAAAIRSVKDRIADARTRLADALETTQHVAWSADVADVWPTSVARRNALVSLAVERVEVDRAGSGARSFNHERVRILPR